MTDAVIFGNVDIVFGDQPHKALALVDQGKTRAEVLEIPRGPSDVIDSVGVLDDGALLHRKMGKVSDADLAQWAELA